MHSVMELEVLQQLSEGLPSHHPLGPEVQYPVHFSRPKTRG